MENEKNPKVLNMNSEVIEDAQVVDNVENVEVNEAQAADTVESTELPYDPNEYGYPQGGKAPFDGNLVLWAMSLAHAVAVKETSMVYESRESFEATRATGKELVTDLGLQALRLIQLVTQGHMENIDQGIALHQEVLSGAKPNTPKFEMNKVTTED